MKSRQRKNVATVGQRTRSNTGRKNSAEVIVTKLEELLKQIMDFDVKIDQTEYPPFTGYTWRMQVSMGPIPVATYHSKTLRDMLHAILQHWEVKDNRLREEISCLEQLLKLL